MRQSRAVNAIRQLFRGIKQILIPLPLTWSNESMNVGAPYAFSAVYGVGRAEKALETR